VGRRALVILVLLLVACSEEPSSGLPPRGSSTSSSGSGSSSGDPGGTDGGGTTSSSGGSSGGSSGSPTTGPTGSCTAQAHKTGLTAFTHANGLKYSTYAPSTYDKNVGHTVVVLMHGQDSDGVPELNALWKPIADSDDLVLVAPRGRRRRAMRTSAIGERSISSACSRS
jgi:hypothetical protein